MIKEKLKEIDNILNTEIENYKVLSALYDEKTQFLIHSNTEEILNIDEKIKSELSKIKKLDQKRAEINMDIGEKDITLSDYINLAQKYNLEIENNFLNKRSIIRDLSNEIINKENRNKELIKHGLKTVGKLINIIIDGVTKQTQYNSKGKNINNDGIKISSFMEEV